MTSEEWLKETIDDLDTYLASKGIPSEQIDIYLSMKREELSILSSDDLYGIAYEVQAYAFTVQSILNEKEAFAKTCQQAIDRLVGHKLDQYSHIFGMAERWLAAIHDNDRADALHKAMQNPRLVIARLNFLSGRLESMAKTLNSLAYTKQKE